MLSCTDLFAGAGGSSTGMAQTGSVSVRLAINHWAKAVDVHNANHPKADHLCADVSQINPRYTPRTDLLWASPECFTAGHLVTTSRGQVPIEDVQLGDRVLTHTGRWQVVVRTQSRESETVLVKGQGHVGIVTTPSHSFWLRTSRLVWQGRPLQYRRQYGEPGWAPISEAPAAESLWATPITSTSFIAWHEPPMIFGLDLTAAWWLVGRWVGDGSLSFGRNHEVLLTCGFHEADGLRERLADTGGDWRESFKRTGVVFYVSDEKARDWLAEHFGHGASRKQIPTWALQLTRAQRTALLEGYVSADGHVNHRGTRISTVSRALAVSTRLLAEGLGHRVRMGQDKRTAYAIEGRQGPALPQWTVYWEDLAPGRSPEAFEEGIHSWSRVRSVTPTGRTETVYNIEVAHDHSYVLDGIVVKNCTHHSQARGKKPDSGADLFGETLPPEAAERSRATMWDVPRFTEAHGYQAVIVENVVDAYNWPAFQAWLSAMDSFGYDHQMVFLNSMHAQDRGLPAPQSRDRMYVVFWRKGNRKPDLEKMQRPLAWCPSCEEIVASVQHWKNPAKRAGRYRAQYIYRCPKVSCRGQRVEPGWLPAAAAIDWSIRGQRIGDRSKPLAEKTRKRIAAGIARYWSPIHLEAAGHTYDAADPRHPSFGDPDAYYRAWTVDEPLKTLHNTASKALAVPVEGREGVSARSLDEALRTQTTRLQDALALLPPLITRHYGIPGGEAARHTKPADEALRTLTCNGGNMSLLTPFIAELRGGGSTARSTDDPLATVTAAGNHHALVAPYFGTSETAKPAEETFGTFTTRDRYALIMRNNGGGAEMTTPVREVMRTLTTAGHQSVLTPGDLAAAEAQVDDCLFRMLEPHEVAAGMAFPTDYIWEGTRRERVKMAGNAVTPPTSRDLSAAVVESLS